MIILEVEQACFFSPCSKGDNGNFDAALKYGETPISYEFTIKN
ncbi:hypothetical protein [Psychrobacillus sp. L3]